MLGLVHLVQTTIITSQLISFQVSIPVSKNSDFSQRRFEAFQVEGLKKKKGQLRKKSRNLKVVEGRGKLIINTLRILYCFLLFFCQHLQEEKKRAAIKCRKKHILVLMDHSLIHINVKMHHLEALCIIQLNHGHWAIGKFFFFKRIKAQTHFSSGSR